MGIWRVFLEIPLFLPPQFCPALGPRCYHWSSQKLLVALAWFLSPPCPPFCCWRDVGSPWLNPLHGWAVWQGLSPPLAPYREKSTLWDAHNHPSAPSLPQHRGCPLPSANSAPTGAQPALEPGLARTDRQEREEKEEKGKEKGKKTPRGCSGKSEVRAEAFRQPGLECLTHTVTKCNYELQLVP